MNKKIKILALILLLCTGLIVLTGCNDNKENKSETKEEIQNQITAEEIVMKMKEKNSNIGKIVTYTEETDINELLGRPNQYIYKATFEDIRIEQTNQYLDKNYFTEEEINEPIGGTIEVFKTEEDMLKRKQYLQEITSSMSMFTEYSYSKGKCLLRLNKSLTPSQAKEYEELFYNVIDQ